jgi:hypothetical protein
LATGDEHGDGALELVGEDLSSQLGGVVLQAGRPEVHNRGGTQLFKEEDDVCLIEAHHVRGPSMEATEHIHKIPPTTGQLLKNAGQSCRG